MKDISEPIQWVFYRVLKNKINIPDFEKWVYCTKELEKELPEEIYIELISLNFRDKFVYNELEKLIGPFVDNGEFEIRRIAAYLRSIINRDEKCAESVEMMYELYCSGYVFLSRLGLMYGLSVACPPAGNYLKTWEEISKEEQEDLLNELYPDVVEDAKIALSWIENGKIIIKNSVDERGYYEYEDLRNEEEIKEGEF